MEIPENAEMDSHSSAELSWWQHPQLQMSKAHDYSHAHGQHENQGGFVCP